MVRKQTGFACTLQSIPSWIQLRSPFTDKTDIQNPPIYIYERSIANKTCCVNGDFLNDAGLRIFSFFIGKAPAFISKNRSLILYRTFFV
jgi:hypothetical protein